tara:strand:+ start:5216 stop:5602 length:387 start_codon:yes stop_codon:yes gene_type:complete
MPKGLMEEEEETDMMAAEADAPEEMEAAEEEVGEDLEAELGDEEEPEGPAASLEEAVSGLIADWNPQTPEGEQYLQELQEALDNSAGGGVEMEVTEVEGGPIAPSAFGFEIGMMGKEAARRAMGGDKK